jgi:hypothetical protein
MPSVIAKKIESFVNLLCITTHNKKKNSPYSTDIFPDTLLKMASITTKPTFFALNEKKDGACCLVMSGLITEDHQKFAKKFGLQQSQVSIVGDTATFNFDESGVKSLLSQFEKFLLFISRSPEADFLKPYININAASDKVFGAVTKVEKLLNKKKNDALYTTTYAQFNEFVEEFMTAIKFFFMADSAFENVKHKPLEDVRPRLFEFSKKNPHVIQDPDLQAVFLLLILSLRALVIAVKPEALQHTDKAQLNASGPRIRFFDKPVAENLMSVDLAVRPRVGL